MENRPTDYTLKITYDANDGSGAPELQEYNVTDKKVTISRMEPFRDGYMFMGWAVSKNATEATYTAGQVIDNPKKNIVLYAVWKLIKHVVAYNEDEERDNQKDLALLLAKQQEIQRKIANAIRDKKETVNIDFLGEKTIINVKLLEEINEYEKQYKFEEQLGKAFGTAIEKKGKINVDVDFNQEKLKAHIKQDFERREERSDIHDAKAHTVQKGDQGALAKEVKIGLKTGDAISMDMDREFSSSENMRMFVKRAWKIDAKEIYRVKGKDPHDFKYIAKTGNSKEPYKELDLSSHREGHNSRQKIWLIENGELKEKTVDSIMMKGNYAIATDKPDNVMTGHTKTYLVSRTYNGRYLAVAGEEKKGVNRSPKRDDKEKDLTQRSKTKWEIEDVIESAMLAEKVGALIKDNKLSTGEVEAVKELKIDRNMDDKEVVDTINAVSIMKEYGYGEKQIKKALDEFREIPKNKKIDEMIDEKELKEQAKKQKENKPKREEKTMHDDHDEEERILGPKKHMY